MSIYYHVKSVFICIVITFKSGQMSFTIQHVTVENKWKHFRPYIYDNV